jgi:hypothetical protein
MVYGKREETIMDATRTSQEVVKQKLAAFEQLQPEFEECFLYIRDVHGLKRFSVFPIDNTVRYLHALWVCERKDRLFSIYKNIERYEGRYCLQLLRSWQEVGTNAGIVAFLQRKLDTLPFVDLTRQLHDAELQGGDFGLARRLRHGRIVLSNRGMNLLHAFDAMFALSEEQLVKEVWEACNRYEHDPLQIERQLEELDSPIYSYVPHRQLAHQNMLIMNKLGLQTVTTPTDEPGERSWRVLEPTVPLGPFAEHVIPGYQELTSPQHNNIKNNPFVDRPERSDSGTM